MRSRHRPLALTVAVVVALWWVGQGLGQTSRAEPRRPAELTIAATGDILLHGRVVAAARGRGGVGTGGLKRALKGLASTLRREDLAFANLEVPLTTKVHRLAGGKLPLVGAPPEVAQALAGTGLDVVSVANNHAYDQGTRGLELTLEALRKAGVGATGAGSDPDVARRPWIARRAGARVGVVAVTGTLNRVPRRRRPQLYVARLSPVKRTLAAIRAARAQVDILVVSVHWSRDFVPAPTAEQQRLARQMVQAGADFVVGTGPHLLQQVERLQSPRGDAVVAYSLGNLISPQGYLYHPRRTRDGHRAAVHPGARDGAVLRVRFLRRPDGPFAARSIEAVPLWTINNHLEPGPRDIRVVRLGDAPAAIAATRRGAIAKALGPVVRVLE